MAQKEVPPKGSQPQAGSLLELPNCISGVDASVTTPRPGTEAIQAAGPLCAVGTPTLPWRTRRRFPPFPVRWTPPREVRRQDSRMSSILVINAAGRETRVALVENGDIAEFYLERKKDKGIVGNIYKGRVVRVLPGMQAAFLDIGLDKAAFLYVSDVVYDPDFARSAFDLTEGEHDEEVAEVPELAADGPAEHPEASAATAEGPPLEHAEEAHEGDEDEDEDDAPDGLDAESEMHAAQAEADTAQGTVPFAPPSESPALELTPLIPRVRGRRPRSSPGAPEEVPPEPEADAVRRRGWRSSRRVPRRPRRHRSAGPAAAPLAGERRAPREERGRSRGDRGGRGHRNERGREDEKARVAQVGPD